MHHATLLVIGLVAGVFAGMFGIGGGLIIVPALVLLLGLDLKSANGTSLAALIPPVGLLGAAEYYRNGMINIGFAALLAVGLFLGAWFGARITIGLPLVWVRRAYAGFLIVVAIRMLASSK